MCHILSRNQQRNNFQLFLCQWEAPTSYRQRYQNSLRSAQIGTGKYNIGSNPVNCTQTIHTGSSMEMYLHNIPVYTIILIGRWYIDELLKYIRKKLAQFSLYVSEIMIKHQNFTFIPSFQPKVLRHINFQQNHHNNFLEITNI